MIPSNLICRVFHLTCAGYTGTGFTVEHHSRQYLVTAEHLVQDFGPENPIEIFHDKQWKRMTAEMVGSDPDADVAVFNANQILSPLDLKAEPSGAGLFYGQEVFFLGFPFGWKGDAPTVMNGFPIPFAKRATVSMFDFANNDGWMYLDGINNEGFSGGPVGYQVGNSNEWQIAGVIVAYHAVKDHLELNDQPTDFSYYTNSGLIYATPIKRVLDLIEANPVGHPFSG